MKAKHADLSANQTIREAIQKIALRGIVKSNSNVVNNTEKITGYVAKIHTDGDLAGTVDVQEFIDWAFAVESDVKQGYHEGVFLSAIQNNNGLLIVPKLYSEVTIEMDPETKTEYVTMFSHVDIIQLDSHDKIYIGVKEREEFKPDDEEGPDIQELAETGVHAQTNYTKDSIVTDVQGEDEANKVIQTIDSTKIETVVGDNKTSSLIDQEQFSVVHNKATLALNNDNANVAFDKGGMTIDSSESTLKMGGSSVVVEDGTVYLGSKSGTDDAVLGVELANILINMLDFCSQIMTTTMMGPQPPLNIASFISLKAQITAFKSAHSGFLTRKVQVQK